MKRPRNADCAKLRRPLKRSKISEGFYGSSNQVQNTYKEYRSSSPKLCRAIESSHVEDSNDNASNMSSNSTVQYCISFEEDDTNLGVSSDWSQDKLTSPEETFIYDDNSVNNSDSSVNSSINIEYFNDQTSNEKLVVFYTNCDSLLNKKDELELEIKKFNPHVIVLTEIYPKTLDSREVLPIELTLNNYDIVLSKTDFNSRGVCIQGGDAAVLITSSESSHFLPTRLKKNILDQTSTFLYMKFLMVWALVLMADFILEFRFEYLWPFWLLVRSVYDSFKFQGLAFSLFFVSIAITSDVVCYLFIPVQWLFFAASTYVWVQYVWHTERGICLPTVSLWLLFVYIEASVRLRELKNLPFNLDLCRPFAAHCIGYPVVTLGFGFKTYVSYKLRLRKQKEVQKENDFYFQLIQEALPLELQDSEKEKQKALTAKTEEEVISSNGTIPHTDKPPSSNKSAKDDCGIKDSKKSSSKSPNEDTENEDSPYIEQNIPKKTTDINQFDESADSFTNDPQIKNFKQQNGIGKVSGSKLNSNRDVGTKKGKNYNKTDLSSTAFANNKDESAYLQRLENDVKRLKADLQSSRNTEQELKSQLNSLVLSEKNSRAELYQLQQDNENLQNKLHNLVTSRQKDKESLAAAEKKLAEEKKAKSTIEQQLSAERKAKKAEDAAAARAVALAASQRGDSCTDICLSRRRDTENDMKQLQWDLQSKEDKIRHLEKEVLSLRVYKESQNDTEVLMSALAAMQDKTSHLENSLSAETRLKLDLFSALGEAKRQMEILQNIIQKRDEEIVDLKSKVSQAMALIPAESVEAITRASSGSSSPSPLYSTSVSQSQTIENGMIVKSTLNPHASDYTPKPI